MSCKTNEQIKPEYKKVKNSDEKLSLQNGIVLYNNALFTGTIYALYDNTFDTAEIRNYFLGKEDGEWKKFYDNGILREKRFFKEGKKEGEYVAYWINQQKMLDYFFLNDEYQGTCREWNKDGMLIKEMNYVNGHEEGSQKMFYDNGKVRSNYIIKNGKRYGLLGTKNCVNVTDSIFKK